MLKSGLLLTMREQVNSSTVLYSLKIDTMCSHRLTDFILDQYKFRAIESWPIYYIFIDIFNERMVLYLRTPENEI